MNSLTLRTPAKLNLGLEVVGRRPDGYHELVTIFQAIDLYDELTVTPAASFQYAGDPKVPEPTDIARPVLEEAAERRGWLGTLELRKEIPLAAGLGGGSSDAALALRLAMHGQSADEMRAQAVGIGADVPFFIEGGTALATGRGEQLESLPTPDFWFVVVTPQLHIPGKTHKLFAGLSPDDFSDARAVRETAHLLTSSRHDEINALPNAFERQMLAYPEVRDAWDALGTAAGRVALTGAGPSLFSWHRSREDADRALERLGNQTSLSIVVARAISLRHDAALHAVLALLERSDSATQ